MALAEITGVNMAHLKLELLGRTQAIYRQDKKMHIDLEIPEFALDARKDWCYLKLVYTRTPLFFIFSTRKFFKHT